MTEAFENTTENENVDIAVVDVQHEIETQANTEEFEVPVETVTGEVVETKKAPVGKGKPKETVDKVVDAPVTPEWMK